MAAPRLGVHVYHCGTNIAGSVDVKRVAECASTYPNVVVARDYTYVCSDAGQALIRQDINNLKLDRVLIAACSPTLHELTFGKCVEDAGLNRCLIGESQGPSTLSLEETPLCKNIAPICLLNVCEEAER